MMLSCFAICVPLARALDKRHKVPSLPSSSQDASRDALDAICLLSSMYYVARAFDIELLVSSY